MPGGPHDQLFSARERRHHQDAHRLHRGARQGGAPERPLQERPGGQGRGRQPHPAGQGRLRRGDEPRPGGGDGRGRAHGPGHEGGRLRPGDRHLPRQGEDAAREDGLPDRRNHHPPAIRRAGSGSRASHRTGTWRGTRPAPTPSGR
jgi:hypothetical protein